jgi:hypothetical protein
MGIESFRLWKNVMAVENTQGDAKVSGAPDGSLIGAEFASESQPAVIRPFLPIAYKKKKGSS